MLLVIQKNIDFSIWLYKIRLDRLINTSNKTQFEAFDIPMRKLNSKRWGGQLSGGAMWEGEMEEVEVFVPCH